MHLHNLYHRINHDFPRQPTSVSDRQTEQLLAQAMQAARRGDGAAQLAFLDRACATAPRDPLVLNSRGMLHLQRQEYAEAADMFARAAKEDPKAPALWMNLAKAQRLMGDDEGERKSLEQVLSLDRRDFLGQLRMAELHQRLGETQQALQAWHAVLQLAAGSAQIAPDLRPVLDQARAWIAREQARVGEAVAAATDPYIAPLSQRDARRTRAFIDHALGRRRIYANECAGVCYPFLPADEFFDREHFPWMAALEAQTDVIREELLGIIADPGDALRPYIRLDEGSPQSKWTPLDRSLDWGACFLWEYGAPNAPVLERCPATAEVLRAIPRADIPGRGPTAFFSLLRPRKRIPPHTGVTNTRTIVHLPLVVPPGCAFRVGGETRPWRVGEAFAFDDTIEHEAWNDSDELRAVLIFDVWNPHLSLEERDVIARYFRAADASGGGGGGPI